MSMEIVFSDHANKKIQDRGISKSAIRNTIWYPDYYYMEDDFVKVYMKRIGERTLKVCTWRNKNGDIEVKTAFISDVVKFVSCQ